MALNMGPLSAIKKASASAEKDGAESPGAMYAQDIIDAIGDGDADALHQALAMHYATCTEEGGAETDETEDDEYDDEEE